MTLARVTIAPRRSVALFALLAILMVIASYVVIVALAAACVYLPYLALTSTTNLQVLILFLGGIAAAGAMLWPLVPRRERPTPIRGEAARFFLFKTKSSSVIKRSLLNNE